MVPEQLASRYREIAFGCRYRLTGHPPRSTGEQLEALREWTERYPEPDVYGRGELIESFEQEIATLLGKASAVFLPSGTMAQCIALRILSDRAGTRRVGFHATSHLELHEQHAYRELYGLEAQLLGEPDRVVTLADLTRVEPPLAAVLLELPMREIGGQLPAWEDLCQQASWARAQGVALHLDGARLWQCAPAYGKSLAEIAGLFDSVYVSFYKDIGGIAGSILAGESDFVAEARRWIRRTGGNLYAMFPYVLAARAGMARNLAGLPRAVESAAWLASRFAEIGLPTTPLQPPTNLFHLRLPVPAEALVERACAWSERHNVFIMPMPARQSGQDSVLEFSLGSAIESLPREQWEALLSDFYMDL